MILTETQPDSPDSPRNGWRRITPGVDGWVRTARPGDPNKYFIVSADCHVNEPLAMFELVEPEFRDRIPRREARDDGSEFLITEGNRPQMVRAPTGSAGPQPLASFERSEHDKPSGSRMEREDVIRSKSGRTVVDRLRDQAIDGIDAEVLFPNTGLLCWATPDPAFAQAMCRAWNRWVQDLCGAHMLGASPRMLPLALLAPGDLPGALSEIAWAAENGFRGLCLGNSPVYGVDQRSKPQYNDPLFEPMWSLIEETGLPVTFHVSTGKDPRAVGGNGGAVINYVCHSMETTIEPLVQLISSGVLERHPAMRAGIVESGIGFVPWLLETMDYAFRAHHFWVRPVIPELPSTYFRRQCFATFQEDHHGLADVERLDIVNNVLWANDYPHHEGSWPHSAAAIERNMGHLSDASRARILGLNAAELFGLPIPKTP